MKTKPMLFSTPMVRALLSGCKTETRRVVKPQPEGAALAALTVGEDSRRTLTAACAPYQTGDILYVRETWAHPSESEIKNGADPNMYLYAADQIQPAAYGKWHPSIHMPKEAARIFLRVTNVWVERLQDSFSAPISPIFALRAEGMDIGDDCRECIENYREPCCVETVDEDGFNMYGGECGLLDSIRGEFSELWDSTIKPADRALYGWEANPWVWVIEFEQVSRKSERWRQ